MGPKKQQKLNGFMVFMMDMKPRLEAEGHKFKSMTEVHPICTPMWESMTKEQKDMYQQRAKGTPKIKEEKYDTRGVPLSWKEKEEQRKRDMKQQVFQKIEDMISFFDNSGILKEQRFHFAHFNYAVATDEQEFPPCELAIIKYSLLRGIEQRYHEFVDPGKLRMGYSFAAKEHSLATHCIPAVGFKLSNNDYPTITDNIKDILRQPDGGLAPLFILDSESSKVKWMLDWLIQESCKKETEYPRENPFVVYSLNKLVYELRRHADLNDPRLKFTSTQLVAEKLCSGDFTHRSNMACQWHDDEDKGVHCSLTAARNYAFIISDLCCENYGIALLPNRHCPAEVIDETKYEVLPKMPRHDSHVSDSPSVRSVNTTNTSFQESTTDTLPRMPNTFGRLMMGQVGSRVAASFSASTSAGRGRGLLGLDETYLTPSPGRSEASPVPPEAVPEPRVGRGRGSALLDDY